MKGPDSTEDHREEIGTALRSDRETREQARAIAATIRRAGGFRWVGIYGVGDANITALAWDGPGAPAYPSFPVDLGLCGAAVKSGATVVVDDVANDPRYLMTFGTTRSEMVVPVTRGDRVVALIDVESDRVRAFADHDQAIVEQHGSAVVELFAESEDPGRSV
jgi:GAF domain-containing protein